MAIGSALCLFTHSLSAPRSLPAAGQSWLFRESTLGLMRWVTTSRGTKRILWVSHPTSLPLHTPSTPLSISHSFTDSDISEVNNHIQFQTLQLGSDGTGFGLFFIAWYQHFTVSSAPCILQTRGLLCFQTLFPKGLQPT